MLSILIPTYNYNTVALVIELNNQVKIENIAFEILVSDDASNNLEIIESNKVINTIENCNYFINGKNLGRGLNINSMVSKAKYPWILLIDCDTIPKDSFFIKNYLKAMQNSNKKAFFGGIIYKKEKAQNDEILRWIYGIKREEIGIEKRKKQPYKSTLTSNILLQKELLINYPFHQDIRKYGFEDLVFILRLKENNIEIEHIENAVYHLNIEKSIIFIEKYHSSLNNLHFLIKNKIIDSNDTNLSKTHSKMILYKLDKIYSLFYIVFKSLFKKNLLSQNPSLFIFDLYKLGYYCSIQSE
jgi:hypothetical protein